VALKKKVIGWKEDGQVGVAVVDGKTYRAYWKDHIRKDHIRTGLHVLENLEAFPVWKLTVEIFDSFEPKDNRMISQSVAHGQDSLINLDLSVWRPVLENETEKK
jgi:hypothetical protein